MKSSLKLLALLLVPLLNLSLGSRAALASDCESSFRSTIRISAGDYIRTAQSRADSFIAPQFSNPSYEQAAQKTWSGVQGPALIQEFLVPGTSLISHALKGANEPGVVKTSSGNMVHLRLELGAESTNIGVSYNAQKENFGRSVKSYVRESAEAVILFVHGGGTNTTGHHVAAQIMDYMNPWAVDVISLDLKWHGEGARNSPESVKKELEILREYAQVLTGRMKKPVFLVGHSMGGVVADLYMRNFPNDRLFAGVVSLSTVGDVAPGQPLEIKRKLEAEIDLKNRDNEHIPADERNLGAQLARQGKISPTCGFYCDVLMTGVDWSYPAHQGAEYLPALYLIGRGDGLYQGYEKSFADGVARLKNVEFVVFDQRRDIKAKDGQKVTIGHLIFDHKPLVEFSADVPAETQRKVFEGKIDRAEFELLRSSGKLILEPQFTYDDLKSPETFVRIRNFISKITGRTLPKVEPTRDALDDVVQEYMKNLAFREFARSHVYLHMRATPEGAGLGQEISRLSKAANALSGLEKKGELTAEQREELAKLRAKNAELVAIMANKGLVSEKNQAKFQELQKALEAVKAKMTDQALGKMPQTTTVLKLEAEKIRQALNQQKKIISEVDAVVTSPGLKVARADIDQAYETLMKQDSLVRDLSSRYLLSQSQGGRFPPGLFENLPPEVREAYEGYSKLSAAYQKSLQKFDSYFLAETAAGNIEVTTGASRTKEEVVQAAREAKRLAENLKALQVELELRSQNRARHWAVQFDLQMQMTRLVEPGYFVPEVYTIEGLLNKSAAELAGASPEVLLAKRKELSSILQKIWADWNSVWAERPQGSGDSDGLY